MGGKVVLVQLALMERGVLMHAITRAEVFKLNTFCLILSFAELAYHMDSAYCRIM